jgi:hypothetical protein
LSEWTEPFLVSLADDADFPRVPVAILPMQADWLTLSAAAYRVSSIARPLIVKYTFVCCRPIRAGSGSLTRFNWSVLFRHIDSGFLKMPSENDNPRRKLSGPDIA